MTSLDTAPTSYYCIILLWIGFIFWNIFAIPLPEQNEILLGVGFTVLNMVLFLRLDYVLQLATKEDKKDA